MSWSEMNLFGKTLAVLCVISVAIALTINLGVLIAILAFGAG